MYTEFRLIQPEGMSSQFVGHVVVTHLHKDLSAPLVGYFCGSFAVVEYTGWLI
jgi:ribonuclease BN (tRNA processing enzyme)